MVKYVYICSANFSGSTLLDLLIGSHTRVTSLGEITQLPRNLALNTRCTCGQPIKSCSVWNKVVNILSEHLAIDIHENPYALNLGYIYGMNYDKKHQTLFYKFIRKIKSDLRYGELRYKMSFLKIFLKTFYEVPKNKFLLYDVANSLLGTDLVVDSSKAYLEAIGLYKMMSEKVRIILLVRDGRAVFYSGLKRNYSKKKSLSAWKNVYSRILPLLKQHVSPEHVLFIKYEDLTSNVRKELLKICNFIGLEFEEGMLDFKSKIHHLTDGSDMRFNNSSVIKTDILWKQKLSRDDYIYFEKYAGSFNRSFGYE